MSEIDIRLRERPDGFAYGEAQLGDRVVRVSIIPPEYLWRGETSLDDTRPDATHWQVFANGELIARIAREEDVSAALVPLLTSSNQRMGA